MNESRKYDLIERTARVGEAIIDFCKTIKSTSITDPLIRQIIRSGTSIGANYAEANEACSKKDFINKLSIAKKETRETLHWLRMLVKADSSCQEKARIIYQEVNEILLIFSKSISTASDKSLDH